MVALGGINSIDRLWEFEDCMFHNFWDNWVDRCAQVFYVPVAVSTATISLKDCMHIGYDEWQDRDYEKLVQINMPIASVAGGCAIEPTTSVE